MDSGAEAQLAAIVQSSHDAIVSKDVEDRITSWNPGAQRLYGYTGAEVLGWPARMLVDPDFRTMETAMVRRILSGERVGVFRTRRVHQSGAPLQVSVSLSPIVSSDGRIVGISSSTRDVGELAAAESRYQGLLEAAPEGIMCTDGDGVITLANAQATGMLGYGRAELIDRRLELFLPISIRDGRPHLQDEDHTEPLAALLAAGKTAQLTATRRDGSTFPADIRLSTVDAGGVTVTVTIHDVSERLVAQAALRESDSRLRQLAASVDVGFVLRALQPPEFLYVSPGFNKVYGYDPIAEREDPEAMMRRIHPDDRDSVVETYWELARAGLPAQAEFRIVRRDGQVRWVRATTGPVIDADGHIRRSAGTAEDITDRKTADAVLLAALADAEKANAAKNEFLSRTSHELRTPLNAVLGFAQVLEMDDLTDDQQSSLRHILQAGRHLLALIDDVLDIATVERDQLDTRSEPVSVHELLAETVQLNELAASAAGITVHHSQSGGDEQHVDADRQRLRQVLMNLLSNAIKYNRHGGQVHVDATVDGQDPAWLNITVRDTGRGIRPEHLPRLFTPFDRLDAASTGIEGTGIGLALSQRLMTAMGGTLTATSQIGTGSTFTASLPHNTATVTPVSAPG